MRDGDRQALELLAALEGRSTPEGDLLLVRVDGLLVVAVRVSDGAMIADPFVPTADLVSLLDLHAKTLLASEASPRRTRPRWRLRLRSA
jgi:hypothetical protein